MSSAGSSRSSSLSNLFDSLNMQGKEALGILKKNKSEKSHENEEDEGPHASDLHEDPDLNPNLHYNFTEKDAMGSILLSMFKELTALAGKSNKSMSTTVDDICEKYYNHALAQKQKIKHRVMQTTADWEQYMIEKELNSHAPNQVIEAPTSFSPVPTLDTPRKTADVMKLLPSGAHKFSGAPNGTSIVEYLYNLNQVQEQCHLSLSEFYKIMLASTTGAPYTYIMGAVLNEEDPTNIYHNLILRYDDRLQPEEARIKLYAYKVPKTSTLAQAETVIHELATLATSSLPKGASRKSAFNHEVVNALFRALPHQSATMARNLYSSLSAKLTVGATAGQLSRMLNLYRHTINEDIRMNGVNENKSAPFNNNFGNRFFRRTTPLNRGNTPKRYVTYNITAAAPVPAQTVPRPNNVSQWKARTGPSGPANGRPNFGSPRPFSNYRNPNYQPNRGQFYRPNPPNPNFSPIQANAPRGRYNGRGSFNRNFIVGRATGFLNPTHIQRGMQEAKRLARAGARSNPGFMKGANPSKDYCSLCGKQDHRAVDECPYMVNDAGRKVPVMPCKDTCPDCPPSIKVRLNHPSFICPYRQPFGPLSK
jgi:hypothetical protein